MDNLEKTIDDYLEAYKNRVDCFSPFHTPEFISPELDIQISPEHFCKWLEKESRDTDYNPKESYAHNVGSMCEFSCLYMAMMFCDKNLKGDLKIISGHYGWWEHYWLSYKLDGVEYFIDLTLQQFVGEAPKIAISLAKENPRGYNYDEEYNMCIKEYVNNKMGFEFYENPKEL